MADSKLVKEWFRYANNDLIIAQHSFTDMYPKLLEIACYHCQQAAEKALKGFLFYKEIDPPRKHDLRLLNALCFEQDTDFGSIKTHCADLTYFGVVTRYPNELEVDEIITKTAIEKAEQVYDFCFTKVSAEEIKPMETPL
jgi:HEPN domain-containing protein